MLVKIKQLLLLIRHPPCEIHIQMPYKKKDLRKTIMLKSYYGQLFFLITDNFIALIAVNNSTFTARKNEFSVVSKDAIKESY